MMQPSRFPAKGGRREAAELSSWKEIAAHFAVTVRTVQNWEAERGLPVKRLPGPHGRVWASVAELDDWKASSTGLTEVLPIKRLPSGRRARLWLLLGAAVLLISAVLLFVRLRPGKPISWRIDGSTLITIDKSGQEVWRRSFPRDLNLLPTFAQSAPVFADFDGDGVNELAVAAPARPASNDNGLVYIFDHRGVQLGRWAQKRSVETAAQKFQATYEIRALLPVRTSQGTRLLVLASQHPYYPASATLLDAKGNVLREYWHSGHLSVVKTADLEGDGRAEIYMGAVNNARKQAELIVLDPDDFGGASREDNPMYQIQQMAPPREVARILFPTSVLAKALGPYPFPDEMLTASASLHIGLAERDILGRGLGGTYYDFGPRLRLDRISFADWSRHALRQLINEKRVSPQELEDQLPELRKLEVLTPWREPAASK